MHSVQYRRRTSTNRCDMSKRYQCQRRMKGYGSIRVRVILGNGNMVPSTDSAVCASTATVRPRDDVSVSRKKRRAAATVLHLEEHRVMKEILMEKDNLQKKLDLAEEKLISNQRCLELEVEKSKKKLRSSQNMLSRYRSKSASHGSNDMAKLCKEIERVMSSYCPGKHTQTKAKILLDALSSGILFHREGVLLLNEMKRLYVRNIFKDWKVLKAFDCSAIGAFKTSTVKALNLVLDDGRIGLFPSLSAINRARKLLDNKASEVVGCHRELTKYGEVYFLNFNRAIHLLLKATGLYEKAQQTNVSIPFTADGALLLSSRTHVSCGVKITDVDGIHPISKLPLSCTDIEPNENFYNCMQSRELCAILVMADAKDSKEVYDDMFKDFYNYAESLRVHGMPACNGKPALKPFLVAHPQDMKSTQTVSKWGGNCKMNFFVTFAAAQNISWHRTM